MIMSTGKKNSYEEQLFAESGKSSLRCSTEICFYRAPSRLLSTLQKLQFNQYNYIYKYNNF